MKSDKSGSRYAFARVSSQVCSFYAGELEVFQDNGSGCHEGEKRTGILRYKEEKAICLDEKKKEGGKKTRE